MPGSLSEFLKMKLFKHYPWLVQLCTKKAVGSNHFLLALRNFFFFFFFFSGLC